MHTAPTYDAPTGNMHKGRARVFPGLSQECERLFTLQPAKVRRFYFPHCVRDNFKRRPGYVNPEREGQGESLGKPQRREPLMKSAAAVISVERGLSGASPQS